MTEGLIDRLSRLGYNLIIEGTLRTSEVSLRTATLLRERGYDVSLALMAVKTEISLLSCQIRYEEMRIAGTTPRRLGTPGLRRASQGETTPRATSLRITRNSSMTSWTTSRRTIR